MEILYETQALDLLIAFYMKYKYSEERNQNILIKTKRNIENKSEVFLNSIIIYTYTYIHMLTVIDKLLTVVNKKKFRQKIYPHKSLSKRTVCYKIKFLERENVRRLFNVIATISKGLVRSG